MPTRIPSLRACYDTVCRMLKQAQVLEKYASTVVQDEALEMKSTQALDLMQYIKEASKLDAAKALIEKVPQGVRTGLAYGAGAAIPATAGGAYLLHRGGEEAKDTATHIRNQALLTALGVGGVGAGLMGVHRALSPNQQISGHKISSAQDTDEVLIEKLATVGYLDVILEEQEKHGTTSALQQDAMECRRLNAEHGMDLLQQMLA